MRKQGMIFWSYEGSDQGDGNPSIRAASTTCVLFVEDRTLVSQDRTYLFEDHAIAVCFRCFKKSEIAAACSLIMIC